MKFSQERGKLSKPPPHRLCGFSSDRLLVPPEVSTHWLLVSRRLGCIDRSGFHGFFYFHWLRCTDWKSEEISKYFREFGGGNWWQNWRNYFKMKVCETEIRGERVPTTNNRSCWQRQPSTDAAGVTCWCTHRGTSRAGPKRYCTIVSWIGRAVVAWLGMWRGADVNKRSLQVLEILLWGTEPVDISFRFRLAFNLIKW